MSAKLDNATAVDHALEAIRALGLSDGEAYLRESQSTTIEARDGAVESVIQRGERGVGIRVLDEGRMGFAYTSDLTSEGIGECAELARASARATTPDPDLAIARETSAGDGLAIHDAGFAGRDVAAKTRVALAIEEAGRAADPRVRSFEKTTYGDGEATTMLGTTAGARGEYRETSFSGGTACVAVEGDERQSGWYGDSARSFAALDPAYIGARAARRAVEKLGARPFATQTVDVVLDPEQGAAVLGAISALFSAENVLKRKSLLRDRVGERVAAAGVTIRDEGRRRGGQRTAPFDGEGTPTQDVVLVDDGVLRGYLHSIKSAKRMKTRSTGSARRPGYLGTPHVGVSNFSMAPGTSAPDDLLRSTDRALAITSLLNLHTIDPISGDFSLGATAVYLERGEPRYPVKGIAIAGNLLELLGAIAGVGNDLRFSHGIGSPTLVVRGVSVGGQ